MTAPAGGTAMLEGAATAGEAAADGGFAVHLDNFSGPFDLLLSLIAKHQLDITEVALATVTDEFISYLRADTGRPLDETSEFLVVAATLLDLKAARLLPAGEVDDEEDIALLEARDLLFARLLQYRAYKLVAAEFAERLAENDRSVPRAVPLEPQLASLLPELILEITPEALAILAARALAPKPGTPSTVGLDHLHAPAVSVQEEAGTVVLKLGRAAARTMSFRSLVADAGSPLVVVARFLALLELFRDGQVSFEQASALGELTVRLSDAGAPVDTTRYDEFGGAAAPEGSDAGEGAA